MRRKGALSRVLWLFVAGLFIGCGGSAQGENGRNVPEITREAQTNEKEPGGKQQDEKETEEKELPEEKVEVPERQTEEEKLQKTEAEDPGETTVVYGKMPVLLIETEQNMPITDDEVYTNCTVSVTNCDEDEAFTDAAAGIRIRGNSTQMYAKKPYRIKFEEKKQLLGLSEGAHKSWVLLAEFNDPALLRNFITYRLANALSGISYVTDCEFVEVYLNGEYAGVYLLAEQTQVDADRIAIDETGVTDPTVTDTGYLLELEADLSRRNEEGKEGEAWFAVTGYADEKDNSMQMLMERTFDASAAYYVVKSDARSTEQTAYIRDYMIRVYDAVYQEKTKAAVEELVDLTSAVDMYLVQLIANDYDNNYSSMYLYKDAGGKLMFGAPWDFDLGYGNFTGHTDAEDTVYVYHLLRQLGEYDWFREMAAKRYTELSEGENSLIAQMKESIPVLALQYAEEFDREYARWREDLIGAGSFGNFEMPEGFGGWGEFEAPEGFGGWGEFEMPEDFGGWGEFEMPEDFGGWGDFEMPEGFGGRGDFEAPEGFGGWGEFEMPEGFGNWGEFEAPEGFGGWGDFEMPGNFGGFGGMGNFSYGAVFDTHEEAAEALLRWLEARLTWIGHFLKEKADA